MTTSTIDARTARQVLPRTRRPRETEVVYEQCPWDPAHVEALYPVLRGQLISDGDWHDFPVAKAGAPQYRVTKGYFQVLCVVRKTELEDKLRSIGPAATNDDSEWYMWSFPDGSGYALSSTFAVIPGRFDSYFQADQWLGFHGLGLQEDRACGTRGVAYFADIEPGCIADAMERLAWLESVLALLYSELDKTARDFLQAVETESKQLREAVTPIPDDEIVPVPEAYQPVGRKLREPLG